jgi:carboxyl-terminal processing protease
MKPVELTVQRDGRSWKVRVERREFQPETVLGVRRRPDNSWHYFLDGGRKVAHVRLATLGQGTAAELQQVLSQLQAEGMRGLLLDLRWCPGGYLTPSLDVTRLFLGECVVATVRSRTNGEQLARSRAGVEEGEKKFLDMPVVVLVNGETSGGAELIAAALQDNQRAVVCGTRTRGKASIQSAPDGLPVPNTDAGLKLTTGTFVRPNGKGLHRFPDSKPGDDWGVRPEPRLEFRVSPELNRQLREWWLLQTLRPGSVDAVLPLDDPANDPQRQAAVQELLRLMK